MLEEINVVHCPSDTVLRLDSQYETSKRPCDNPREVFVMNGLVGMKSTPPVNPRPANARLVKVMSAEPDRAPWFAPKTP